MSTAELIVVICLVVLGLAHSMLGESKILRPLFTLEWRTPLSRSAMEKILRFAWHLTSIAWIALAAIVAGAEILHIVGAMSLLSSAMIFFMLRSHLAWPLFLIAGLAAFHADRLIDTTLFRAGAIATVVTLVAAAAVHVYWAGGGTWMIDRALPVDDRPSGFVPGTVVTLVVAAALTAYAVVVSMAAFDNGPVQTSWLVFVGIALLSMRAIGDTKVAGFTKTVRTTKFAVADDRWFTPLCVFLALGATGALLA